MDALIPFVGALIGAGAALAGQWVSHRAAIARDRRKLQTEKIEAVVHCAFAARAELCRCLDSVMNNGGDVCYAVEAERLKALVLLHAPKVKDDMRVYLACLSELQDWTIELHVRMHSSADGEPEANTNKRDAAQKRWGADFGKKGEALSAESGRAVNAFVDAVLLKYRGVM